MSETNWVVEPLKQAALATLYQLVVVLGVFFVAGLLLYLLARFTRNTFARAGLSKFEVVITGWLGTSVHELGHTFFCLMFLHRIESIKLFRPDSADGSLGYVHHSYNKRNLYQRIGNFFIGVGPVIFGAMALFAVMYFFLPNYEVVRNIVFSPGLQEGNLLKLGEQWQIIAGGSLEIIRLLSSPDNFEYASFWIFLYLSLAISSHMELSPADLKSMFSGLGILALFLFAVNIIALIFGYGISENVLRINTHTGILFGLFLYAIIISLINFLVSYFVLSLYTFIRFRRLVNPFF